VLVLVLVASHIKLAIWSRLWMGRGSICSYGGWMVWVGRVCLHFVQSGKAMAFGSPPMVSSFLFGIFFSVEA
jgi:hypothetical protein